MGYVVFGLFIIGILKHLSVGAGGGDGYLLVEVVECVEWDDNNHEDCHQFHYEALPKIFHLSVNSFGAKIGVVGRVYKSTLLILAKCDFLSSPEAGCVAAKRWGYGLELALTIRCLFL